MEERFMRILVMFDVPTHTKEDRKSSARFRKELLKDGFIMLQFSVYVRICKGVASANSHCQRLELILPPRGNIRALILTEKQFDQMKLLLGSKSDLEEVHQPRQLTLF
ncbi:CRISPR-associated endonuclease Cas2 [Helicobacter sp. 12S02634-8]|uniref:CRISPR-associated endonuclease Cas2 n=1 Tax=Helicobacter sp. 12S02634-8 TaxID=1476199 RepID=UPI00209C57B1|nr:CRISPR-associated endonuclease Cas2 [Helicobacter sp. 12S02634-8]